MDRVDRVSTDDYRILKFSVAVSGALLVLAACSLL